MKTDPKTTFQRETDPGTHPNQERLTPEHPDAAFPLADSPTPVPGLIPAPATPGALNHLSPFLIHYVTQVGQRKWEASESIWGSTPGSLGTNR